MAEPARNLNDDERQAHSRKPELKAVEGGGEGDGKPQGDLRSVNSTQPTGSPYDDEQNQEGFYKNNQGLKSIEGGGQGDGKPRGDLKSVDSDGFSYKPDAETSAEQAGLERNSQTAKGLYRGGGQNKKSGFMRNMVNTKAKKWVVGSLGTSLVAGIFSLFLSFLPLKLEFIIQNVMRNVTAATYSTIEDRMETMFERYMTRRIFIDTGGSEYNGNTMFGTLYGRWKSGQIETKLFEKHGLRIQGVFNGEPVEIGQKANSWRILTADGTDLRLNGTKIDMDLLDTDLKGRETRRAIRQIARDLTGWHNIIQRRNIRRILVNKFDVPDWKVPDAVNDKRATYANKKLAAKKWLVQRAIGPFSTRYATFFACILDNAVCGDMLKQNDPDIIRGNTADLDAEEIVDVVDADTIDGKNIDAPDLHSGGGLVDNFLSKFITKKSLQIISSSIGFIGLIDMLAAIDEGLKEGAISEALYDMKTLNYVSDAVPMLTANSQLIAGDLTSEAAGILLESVDGFQEHPLWQVEFGTLNDRVALGTAVYAQSDETVAYDCDGDPATPNEVLPIEEPICEHETIYKDYEAFTDSLWYSTLTEVLDVYNSTLGIIVGWIIDFVDFVVGPLVDFVIDILGLSELIAKVFEWGAGKLIGPQCTGADVGGAKYACIRGGLEAAQNQLGEEAVNGIGGQYLTDEQYAALQTDYQEQLAWEWSQEPMTTKLFSTDSSRSLLAQAILSTPSSVESTTKSVASLISSPFSSIGSIFSSLAQPVSAQQPDGFNPFGIVHYGYPSNHEALTYEPDTAPELADCELEVDVATYEDNRATLILDEDVEGAPAFPVYVEVDPCALDRTVVEIGSALFSDEADGGLGYDYYEDESINEYASNSFWGSFGGLGDVFNKLMEAK